MPEEVTVLDNSFSQVIARSARRHGLLHPDLFRIAIHSLRSSPSCAENKLYIAPVETTGKMYKAPLTNHSFLKPPYSHGSQQWFPDVDIFQQNTLVLPFSFIKPNGSYREFHVGVVDMQVGTIHMLSPRYEQRMHSIMIQVSTCTSNREYVLTCMSSSISESRR